jgi:hypothetical protein
MSFKPYASIKIYSIPDEKNAPGAHFCFFMILQKKIRDKKALERIY